MRTIVPINSLAYDNTKGGAAARKLITGSDWSVYPDMEAKIRKAFDKIVDRPNGDPLPTHIDDPALLTAVVGKGAHLTLSREQLVAREGVLILCQVPPGKREDVLASKLLPIYHYGFACAGLLAWNKTSSSCVLRLRQSDQSVLVEATQAMCALVSSRKVTRRTRRLLSNPRGSKVVEVAEATPVVAEFGAIELRAVGGDRVANGEVVQLSSALKAYRYLLFDGPKRGLFLVGAILVALSAGLHFGVDGTPASVVDWLDNMVGRLATAAFGAQLVSSAIDYSALAPASTRRGFRFEAGATVKWTWVDGRTRE